MSISDEIKAAKKALSEEAAKKTEPLDIRLNEKVRQVVVYRAPGAVWSDTKKACPPRQDKPEDFRLGMDVHAAAEKLLPEYGRVLDGEDEVELTAEQWADLYEVQPGHVQYEIDALVWGVNDFSPRLEMDAIKKASRAGRKKKRG